MKRNKSINEKRLILNQTVILLCNNARPYTFALIKAKTKNHWTILIFNSTSTYCVIIFWTTQKKWNGATLRTMKVSIHFERSCYRRDQLHFSPSWMCDLSLSDWEIFGQSLLISFVNVNTKIFAYYCETSSFLYPNVLCVYIGKGGIKLHHLINHESGEMPQR